MAMTPKEKATQLIYAFEAFTDRDNEYEFAKQCALIAVDEIRDNIPFISDIQQYWIDVKQEIEKL
jgi:hypothetical protein